MKTVFNLFCADTWGSDQKLIGVFTTKRKAISALKKNIKGEYCKDNYRSNDFDKPKELLEYIVEALEDNNQTQGLDQNFQIEEQELNVLDF